MIPIVLVNKLANITTHILKEINSTAIVRTDNILKLATLFRNAEQSRIDIDIINRLKLVRKTHDTFHIFLMFHFGLVLCINFHKAHSDQFWRSINRFRFSKHQTGIFIFATIKVSEHDRKALLVSELFCDKRSRRNSQKQIPVIGMHLFHDKNFEHILQLFRRSYQTGYGILEFPADGNYAT